MASAVSSVIFIASILNLPRAMWAGIAAMSVLLPFRTDIKKRVCGRIPESARRTDLFPYFPHLPAGALQCSRYRRRHRVGFSASYGWQAVFNSLGAMMIAVSVIGFPQAVFSESLKTFSGLCTLFVLKNISHCNGTKT